MSQALRFIRKNGRVIPIGAAAAGAGKAAHVAVAAAGAHAIKKTGIKNKNPNIKVNRSLDLTGLGLSVASGVIAAATFATPKGLALGHAAAKAIDVGGITANAASVAGRGNGKERAIQGAKQEARNFAVGNAIFLGGIVASSANRKAAVGYAKKGVEYASKILAFARKGVGVA